MALDMTPLEEEIAGEIAGDLAETPTPYFSVTERFDDAEFGWWTSWNISSDGITDVSTGFIDAYGVDAAYYGPKIMRADIEDVSFSGISFPTTIETMRIENLFASSLVMQAVFDFSGEDLVFTDIETGYLGEGVLENSFIVTWNIGHLDYDLWVNDSYEVNVDINYAAGAWLEVSDTIGFSGRVGIFVDSSFDALYSDGVNLVVGDGSRSDFHFHGVNNGSLVVQSGENVSTHVHNSADVLADLSGTDGSYTHVSNSGWGASGSEIIVLGGEGEDYFHFNDSQVAYNPGAGNDDGYIRGGNTIGNLVDGYTDSFVFNGGVHEVQIDQFDEVMIDTGQGQWSVQTVDMIDGNPNGVAHWHGSNGIETAVAYTVVETYDDYSMLG